MTNLPAAVKTVLAELALLQNKQLAAMLAGVLASVLADAFGVKLTAAEAVGIVGGVGLVAAILENIVAAKKPAPVAPVVPAPVLGASAPVVPASPAVKPES